MFKNFCSFKSGINFKIVFSFKNTDPAGDDWIANISGNGDDAWDEGESFEGNGQWDWIDFNEDGILDDGEFEPFLDYGINQLPDNLEGSDYELDNNPGSENNLMYDFGEIFFDTGLFDVININFSLCLLAIFLASSISSLL